MKFYNPETGQTAPREALKRLLNMSIPAAGVETVGAWRLLHEGPMPEVQPGQSLVPASIELVDGQYVQTYRTSGTAQMPEPTLEDRLAAVEDAIAELAAHAEGGVGAW